MSHAKLESLRNAWEQGAEDERDAIILWLRKGGDMVRGKWYARDKEMHGYYKSVADQIASGAHNNIE